MLNCLNQMRLLTLIGFVLILVFASGATSLGGRHKRVAHAHSGARHLQRRRRPPKRHSPSGRCRTSGVPHAGRAYTHLGTTGGSLEAYITNSDPAASLKDKDGNIPKDLTMVTVGTPGPGHNAWMMTSSALVLFMTLPGLALFYGGLVRRKNVLSVLAQCFGITGLVTILWWAFGYSLVFGKSFSSPFYGGSEYFFLAGVNSVPNTDYAYWVSQNVYAMYQMMFAVITPALIVGAIAERMKYWTLLVFMTFWMFLVYFPMAHMVWGITGFMNGIWNPNSTIKAIDFAGGTVVHMTSGWSALILCLMLGPRLGFKKEPMPPHSMVLCMVGTSMLWVGWYGFNAGSAVGADVISSNAFMTTTLATAVGAFTWALMEKILRGKASVLGYCSGAVAGLVVITPACGFVNSTGAVIIGVLAAFVPYFAVSALKPALKYDDALDTFGVHAIGGTLGALADRNSGDQRGQRKFEGRIVMIALFLPSKSGDPDHRAVDRGNFFHWLYSESW